MFLALPSIHVIDENTLLYQTHCLYTMAGQVVLVRRLDNGNRLYFDDVSRGLSGLLIDVQCEPFGECRAADRLAVDRVHACYLSGAYAHAGARDVAYDVRHELRIMAREKAHLLPPRRQGMPIGTR